MTIEDSTPEPTTAPTDGNAPQAGKVPLASYLSRKAIRRRYRQTTGAVERTHWHIIYLKSQGRTVAEIADITDYSDTWVRQLIHRYNEVGPGDFISDSVPGTIAKEEMLRAEHARTSEALDAMRAEHARTSEVLDAVRKEHARTSGELNDVRVVQESMLLAPVPKHPELDIAVHAHTATELSGDYYDFHMDSDATLTVAVGDATGHGAKASMMVTATKSLFKAMDHQLELLELVRQLTKTLKSLNLRGLYMHLILCRYARSRMDFVVAGMPPVLVYRAASRRLYDLVQKAMPLGSFPKFPYQQSSVTLKPGDTLLLMSDGFPELLNPKGIMLEHARVRAAFKKVAHLPAKTIISQLRKTENAWSATRAPTDDITLMVIKRKET